MIKEQKSNVTTATVSKEEFKRNKCFMFFESYLEGADKIKAKLGAEVGYEYLTSIIRYALYQTESDDEFINAITSALKDTIDAQQKKRENGFNRENIEMTETVLQYKEQNPNATQKQISEATGISIGKVNKVLKQYKTNIYDSVNADIHIHDSVNGEKEDKKDNKSFISSNSNLNTNLNTNTNSNLNTNSMNVNVNAVHVSPVKKEKRGIPASQPIKKKGLEDLDDLTLEALEEDLEHGKRYADLYKEYDLKDRVLSSYTLGEIRKIKKKREKLCEQYNGYFIEKRETAYEDELTCDPDDLPFA